MIVAVVDQYSARVVGRMDRIMYAYQWNPRVASMIKGAMTRGVFRGGATFVSNREA